MARKVVNTLVIGRLAQKAHKGIFKIGERFALNATTDCITFAADTLVIGMSTYFPCISYIGRHYSIKAKSNPKLRRYYTTTNCLRENVYKEYLRLISLALSDTSSGDKLQFNEQLLYGAYNTKKTSEVCLTVKNYNK